METDLYGNALRKFYKLFGLKNEGPPQNINVNELFPNVDFSDDIALIEKITGNDNLIKKHNECKTLIDEIANLLGDSSFMDEINDSITDINYSDTEHLNNGIFWHYFASILDPKVSKELDLDIPFPNELPEIKKELLKVQGSLIFRLYISLVYMKEGPTINVLKTAARNRKPISQKAKKLMQCDYVRHIRNALSHSTFKSMSLGIYFNDYDKFETVVSPEFLNSLTTWVMLINLQCSNAVSHKIDGK